MDYIEFTTILEYLDTLLEKENIVSMKLDRLYDVTFKV